MDAIYLDMDGVLADFDGALRERGVRNGPSFLHIPPSEWTDEQRSSDAAVRMEMEKPDFWPSIPVMPGAKSLLHTAKRLVGEDKVFILTATPRLTAWRDRIALHKQQWAWAHLSFDTRRVFTCLRTEKQQYARPTRILVDDLASNCAEWREAGGVAIQHQLAIISIAELEDYCHEPAF